MSLPTVITDAAGVATAVGVLFGAAQLLLSRTNARTDFEDRLSEQYRQIVKPRLAEGLLEPLSANERAIVAPYYEYFDLCNEQVFLRMQGRISRRTWNEWQQGIETNLMRGGISQAWNVIAKQDDFPDFQELRLLFSTHFRRDPRAWNPAWRRALRRERGGSDLEVQHRARSGGAVEAPLA